MPPANFKDELIAEMSNLRAFAISLSGSVPLADDLVQETLLRAWSKSDKFQTGTNLRAWLFTILRNFYYSSYRKHAREVQDSDGGYANKSSCRATRRAISTSRTFARLSPCFPRNSARF